MPGLDGEQEIFDTLRNRLETTLVSDALDAMGIHGQAMPASLKRPAYPGPGSSPCVSLTGLEVSLRGFL